MGRVEGKVAFISGAARGQSRAEAVRPAQEGADIIAFDICEQIATVEYPMGTEEDLAETVRLVEALDRRIVARKADARDLAALEAVVAEGTAELGPIGIVVANAGIAAGGAPAWEATEEAWRDVLDVNLLGVWKTARASLTPMVDTPSTWVLMTGGKEDATRDDAAASTQTINALPIPWLQEADMANAVLYLASDEARYVTGTPLYVDAGSSHAARLPDAV